MSEQDREWNDSVVAVADEIVQQHGANSAIRRLQERRQASSDELQARCNEAIAWIRREVADE